MSVVLTNNTIWKWSSTMRACGSAVRIPAAYGSDGSIATTFTAALNSMLCNAIQCFTHAPERPGASPMILQGGPGPGPRSRSSTGSSAATRWARA